MRISANREEKYPLLGALLESINSDIEANPAFKSALFESCGGKDAELAKALTLRTNPWVTVEAIAGGDPRGAYSTDRRNTIVIAETLADRLVAGGDPAAYGETIVVLTRGLVHWLAGKDWKTPDSPPGVAFERLLTERQITLAPPAVHEPVPEPEPGPTHAEPSPETPPPAIAYRLGATILGVAKRHLGQKYRFTPTPDYDDPDWQGPFDCAEYASYCAFRAYRIPYGVVPDPAKRYNSYSGYWQRDAREHGVRISWRDALHVPGSILLRNPPGREPPPYGHVAISLGNGRDTYEARGKQFGVVKHTALGRSWNTGVLIPGVLYDMPEGLGSDLLLFKVLDPPAGHSPIVEKIQKRLVKAGLLAKAQVNGIYDVVTATAISAFQDRKGIVSDGEVGPETGAKLGLGDIWKKAPVADKPAFAAPLPDTDADIDMEILTLARTLYGEARGEPKEGIEAVANVIVNRVMSKRYPNTVSKVCLQRLQFSCWNDNDPNRKIIARLKPGDNPVFDMVLGIARRALLGGIPSLVAGALHYHAKSVKPSWVKNSPAATLVARIGAHLFWSGIR
ncbi:cell wall hydrolase [Bauldia sp.]|uniref:cell wall hydrolase n=1 Tax=Bauldia sp. TaxID=2575872 RepID=UPI003BADB336